MKFTVEKIKEIFKEKGYSFFENGEMNLNIIHIRTKEIFDNSYSDISLLVYKLNNKWVIKEYPSSTMAGWYYESGKNMNPKGVGVVVEGQYKSSWRFINSYTQSHKSPHLNQSKPIKVYRDKDKDHKLDRVNIEIALDSFNTHKGGRKRVDNWSAGCTVIRGDVQLDFFQTIAKSAIKYGDTFTQTWLNIKDFE